MLRRIHPGVDELIGIVIVIAEVLSVNEARIDSVPVLTVRAGVGKLGASLSGTDIGSSLQAVIPLKSSKTVLLTDLVNKIKSLSGECIICHDYILL